MVTILPMVGTGIHIWTPCIKRVGVLVYAFLQYPLSESLIQSQQKPGVRMQCSLLEVIAPDSLYHPSPVHHTHPVTCVRNRIKVMRNQHDGQSPLTPQFKQKREYLRCNKRVQTGRWLVRNNHARLQQERTPHGNPLALST